MNNEFTPENCYCHFRCHCTVSPLPSPSSSPLSFPSTIAVITPDALTVALPVASPLWFWTPEADEACIAILSSLCFPLSFVYFPSPCFYSTRHSCSPGTRALLISEMQCAGTCPSLFFILADPFLPTEKIHHKRVGTPGQATPTSARTWALMTTL